MKNCKIVSLNRMFNHLPSLETVDLTSNLLVSLDIPTFIPMTELRFVDLENNFIKCDKPTQYLMDWFRQHNIKYDGPFCG